MRWAAVALAAALAVLSPYSDALAQAEPVEVRARPVTHFRLGSDERFFGPLEFVGGFEMRSPERRFGQFSALRFLEPGKKFAGVADHGFWFFGSILRDDDLVPVGVADFTMQAMLGDDGEVIESKLDKDAEALDISGDIATVAFERRARITEYALEPADMGKPVRHLDIVVPRHELRSNQGFETLVRAPQDGPLQGARLVIAERSLDEEGNLFSAILEGPGRGLFKVVRSDDFDVTDGAFLPDGDLLLLERRFSLASGVAMRLRRIAGASVRAGALLDGAVLMEANMGYQIDNMEGLDVWRRSDGKLILSLLSDNNQSFLQRTLYLEFILHDE